MHANSGALLVVELVWETSNSAVLLTALIAVDAYCNPDEECRHRLALGRFNMKNGQVEEEP